MKHYKSVEFLSNFQNVKPSCTNLDPSIEDFLATVLLQIRTSVPLCSFN